jgi:hypothetical protein
VELEGLERTRKRKNPSSFSCLLCCSVALLRIALQQAPELGSGALLRIALQQAPELGSGALLRVALPQRSKLRSQAPELCCALLCCALLCCALLCRNAASPRARLWSFVVRCFAARCCTLPGSGALLRLALLRVALLRLWSFVARCFAVAPELCCALLCYGSGALLRIALLQLNPATQ